MTDAILARLMQAERTAVGRRVVAPLLPGGRIRIDLDGLVWLARPAGRFTGWGVFRVQSDRSVVLEREATPGEIEQYARHGRRAQAILVAETGRVYQAATDQRLTVYLCPPLELFDHIEYCFDGLNCWFVDSGRPDALTTEVQQAWKRRLPPDPGWTVRQQVLYDMAARLHPDVQFTRTLRARLEHALGQASAELTRYREDPHGRVHVDWRRGGASFGATVRGDTLQVVSSGICLSGKDAEFDLTSLVPVLREAPVAHDDYH